MRGLSGESRPTRGTEGRSLRRHLKALLGEGFHLLSGDMTGGSGDLAKPGRGEAKDKAEVRAQEINLTPTLSAVRRLASWMPGPVELLY
jgi:hypothetical protein